MEILELKEIYSEDFVFTIFRKEKNFTTQPGLEPSTHGFIINLSTIYTMLHHTRLHVILLI